MSWTDILYTVSVLASAIAAILAWLAKLRWSKEYSAAKDEVIRAKDAHIDRLNAEIANLQAFTPTKLREHYISVKEQLEEYNETLKKELLEKEEEIKKLQKEGKDHYTQLSILRQERDQILTRLTRNTDTVTDIRALSIDNLNNLSHEELLLLYYSGQSLPDSFIATKLQITKEEVHSRQASLSKKLGLPSIGAFFTFAYLASTKIAKDNLIPQAIATYRSKLDHYENYNQE